jgi:hypothetical protein
MHSVDCSEGNTKPDPHHQRTPKNLKDHWCACNNQVSLLNQIYNQESSSRQRGADNAMVLETAKQRYKNQTSFEFKNLHWWEAVRHQPKWRARSAGSSITDLFVSLCEAATDEEVTRPISRDRAKAVSWKRNGRKAQVVKVSLPPQWVATYPLSRS